MSNNPIASSLVGRRCRRIVSVLAIAVVLALVLGALFEWVSSRRVARDHPPAGRLIEVAGVRSHIYCLGSGIPTVIFVSGLGETYDSWSKVQFEIGRSTKACSYDRAGLGWSDPGPAPRDIDRMVTELHNLLVASGISPPYLLVGHSLGGGVIRVFTALRQNELAGLIMVDALHPDFLKRMQLDAWDENMLRTAKWMQRVAPFGIARLEGRCAMDHHPLIQCANFWNPFVGEREALPASVREVGAVTSLGVKPLIILSRDPDPAVGWGTAENRKIWEQMQEELPRLSSQSQQIIVKRATHYIQDDRPDAVIEAISRMLTVVRTQH
jgi:pimeloyl-ACP methyl ester carboxylesterase